MFASISHDTLKAFREGAKNSVWLHRTARGLSALFFAEILYDEFDEIIQAMEEAGDIACDIPLSQVRQWLQHAEDLCRESRVVYELIAK